MADPQSHIGEIHGVYTIVEMLDKKDKYGHYIYRAVCNECGYERFAPYGPLSSRTRLVTKCTHLRGNGEYIPCRYQWKVSRLGNIFRSMLKRCYNPTDNAFYAYGQKGIEVCSEWRNNPESFEFWALKNGYRDDLTIDRIDADKNYSPDNCRWLPLAENTRRAGKVNWITVNGETLTGKQWAQKLGIGVNAINKAVREHGFQKAEELITAMLKQPPATIQRSHGQTWFSVYNIKL